MSFLGRTPSNAPLTTADIADGVVTAAKVAADVATQAELDAIPEYDDVGVRQDIITLALKEGVAENSTKFNLANSSVVQFQADADFNLGGSTTVARNSSEYIVPDDPFPFTSDANTLLLVHSSAPDGNTTFTDSSSHGRTVVGNGSLHHEETAYKFGVSSMQGNGSNNSLMTAHHSDFDAGTGAYTYECWLKTNQSSTTCGIFFKNAGPISFYCYLYANGGLNTFEENSSGVYRMINDSAGSVAYNDNAWHHFAISRPSGSGAKTFVDGTQVGVTLSTAYDWDSSGDIAFGGNQTGAGYQNFGYLDECRISNNARYTANFTPPTGGGVFTSGTALGTTNVPTPAVAVTEVSGVMLLKHAYGANSLGTAAGGDIKVYFTANNSAWTEASSYTDVGTFSTGIKMIKLGKTTCTSGIDVRWKVVWANQVASTKEGHVYGIGLNY